jgi:UPF0716 protein FxsA
LLWLVIGLPLLELYVMVRIGALFGFVTVLLWVLVSGAIGLRILQSRSWSILNRVQQAIAAGQSPGRELLDSAFVMVGGVLLIVPGFITDILGALCLMPPSRYRITRYLEHHFVGVSLTPDGNGEEPRTIDGEYRREE